MHKYIIQKINNNQFPYMVFSSSYENPINYIQDIEKSLHKESKDLYIIFDTILSLGSFTKRFYVVSYKGKHIDMDSIKAISDIDDNIVSIANCFYRKHPELVNNSILTKSQRYLLTKCTDTAISNVQ